MPVLGPPPFSSTKSLHRLRPQLAGFGLVSAGLALLVVALFSGALALLVLSEDLPLYVCSEDCSIVATRATRDFIALRDAAAPYMDAAFAAAILGIAVTTAGTIQSRLRRRPGSWGLRALGVLNASLATVIGFGMAAGFRRVLPEYELDHALLEYRFVGRLCSEAVAGLWLFLVVGVLSLVAFAASNAYGGVRASRRDQHASN